MIISAYQRGKQVLIQSKVSILTRTWRRDLEIIYPQSKQYYQFPTWESDEILVAVHTGFNKRFAQHSAVTASCQASDWKHKVDETCMWIMSNDAIEFLNCNADFTTGWFNENSSPVWDAQNAELLLTSVEDGS